MTINGDLFSGYWSVWLVAGFISGLLLVGLMGRGPIRLFTPLFRILMLPLRPITFVLRRLRIMPKATARARTARNALATARLASNRNLSNQSEIDFALSLPDDDDLEETDEEVAPYDYSEERQSINMDGLYFRHIKLQPDYLPTLLTSQMSDEIGDRYLAAARTFFNKRPALKVNHKALFEDADGAVAVSLFRNFDRRAYYILNEMRKTINGNARRLMIAYSSLLVASAIAVFAAPIDPPIQLGACIGIVVVMFVWHAGGYQKQQQHGIRELRSFLTRYLGRISDRFREVTGNARGVTVGDETDSQKLSERAIKWHKVMIWLPFRTFFLETFVRNLQYQIDRNSAYYLYIWFPTLLAVGAVIGFAWLDGSHSFGALLNVAQSYPEYAFLFTFGVYLHLITKVVIADELDQTDWLGFDDLNVSAAMDEVVGKYAEDVGFWKGRFDR